MSPTRRSSSAAVSCSWTCCGRNGRRRMYPELFHLSFLHTYGVLVAIAFLTGLWMAGRLGKEAGLNVEAVTNLGIYCALAAIVGAKLMMIIVSLPEYAADPRRIFTFETLQAGGVFFGGGGWGRGAGL